MKYLNKFILLACAAIQVLLPQISVSQNSLADELFSNFEFSKTIEYFNQNKIEEGDFESLKKLGLSYYYIHDYKNAAPVLLKLLKQESFDPELYLYLAETFKNIGQFDKAKKYLSEYSNYNKSGAAGLYASIDSIRHWNTLEARFKSFTIDNINTSGANFSPTPLNNGFLYASENTGSPESALQISAYSESTGKLNYGMELDPGVHYFVATTNADHQVLKTTEIHTEAELLYRNNTVCFDAANSKLYITKIYISESPEVQTKAAIYEAQFDPHTNTIGALKQIVFHDTILSYNFGHVFVTANGKEMYFASDMPGGFGGYDIYKSVKNGAKWGPPKNLGSGINGSKDEMFPSFYHDKLYYASNSFAGFGGLDLYVSAFENGQWKQSQNLNAPINSHGDDFSMTFLDDKKGLYCSNRFGGKGDDDIYAFERIIKEKPVDTFVPEPVDSFYIIRDLSFENILFDFNSYELSDHYKARLDSLYDILTERSETRIGLYGYTDPQGKKNYNLNLSGQRAEAVFEYLMGKGLSAERIVNKAKGEGRITLKCKTDSCTEVQNKLNRRVEVVFNPRMNYSGVVDIRYFEFEKENRKLNEGQLSLASELADNLLVDSTLKVRFIGFSDTIHTIAEAQQYISLIENRFAKLEIPEDRIENEVDCYLRSSEGIHFNRIEAVLFREE